MEDYLEINYDPNHKKEVIKQIEHENLYDECFKETAKLWKDYSDSTIELIKNTNLGRIFFKKDKAAYFEIFEDNRTDLIGISKKIDIMKKINLKNVIILLLLKNMTKNFIY